MKKIMVVLAAMMMVMAMVGGAMAANGDVAVSATVNSKCTVTTEDSIDFGTIDPDNAILSDNAVIKVHCTKGSTIHPTCTSTSTSSTAGGNLLNGTSTIAYTIDGCAAAYQSGVTTSGFSATGDQVDVTVGVAAGAAADAVAGDHTDTVVVTVAP